MWWHNKLKTKNQIGKKYCEGLQRLKGIPHRRCLPAPKKLALRLLGSVITGYIAIPVGIVNSQSQSCSHCWISVYAVQTPLRKSSSVCSCVLVQTSRKKACVALLNASHTRGKLKQGSIFKYFQQHLENLLFESDRQTTPATTYSLQNAVKYVDASTRNLGIWKSTSRDSTLCANSAAHRH